jgi:hypothetical protein
MCIPAAFGDGPGDPADPPSDVALGVTAACLAAWLALAYFVSD